MDVTLDKLPELVKELRNLPTETQWVDYKSDNPDLYIIGKDISALANSATIKDKEHSYIILNDASKINSLISIYNEKQDNNIDNNQLESSLRKLLSKNVIFDIKTVKLEEKLTSVIIISKAQDRPVLFENVAYIRVANNTHRLNDYPHLQSCFWDKVRINSFEESPAFMDLTAENAVRHLDYNIYFESSNTKAPSTLKDVASFMEKDGVIKRQENSLYSITNLGAIAFAKNLYEFSNVSRKTLRIVQYEGNNRLNMLKEYIRVKGYAADFKECLQLIMALLPCRQKVINGIKTLENAFPETIVGELLSNALIHQDLSATGTGPTVEIFNNRIEIINPGTPLIDVYRIIDSKFKSRNRKLAGLFCRLYKGEDTVTGWEKVVSECEAHNLTAPVIEIYGDSHTKVTVFSYRDFNELTHQEKLWSCYMHCCIRRARKEFLTPRSLRDRFGLKSSGQSSVSRLISAAIEKKLIKPVDKTAAPADMKYVPYWVSF